MMSVFPPLSRASKSQPYLPSENNANRKRRHPESQPYCFEVRPSKNGVGIFATHHISCGDLIIADEDPIVHCGTSSRSKASVCDVCSTPIGSLRNMHLMVPSSNDFILPYLDDDGQDLVFTTSHIACQQCKEVAWCSNKCHEKGLMQHDIICGSTLLKEFYDNQENPNIFLMATRSITLIFSHMAWLSKEEQTPIEQFYWWQDYGSHPLWWKVGSSKANKKGQATEFCRVLLAVLMEAVRQKRVKIEKAVILQLFTLENVASILGMLQCNVMEYEYPSPTQQYMEHVQDILDEVGDEDYEDMTEGGNVKEDSHMIALKAGCQWLSKNFLDSVVEASSTSNKDKEQNSSPIQPIVGSGLYPLLTLANHDCNPNASIEFLQESNRGSMVATRDIMTGEEICITYIPNGGVGGGDGSEYFRHFKPTRTWKWLNSNDRDDDNGSNDDQSNSCNGNDDGKSTSSRSLKGSSDDCDQNSSSGTSANEANDEEPNEEDQLLEGSDWTERANALLEYGFECHCTRCHEEQRTEKR